MPSEHESFHEPDTYHAEQIQNTTTRRHHALSDGIEVVPFKESHGASHTLDPSFW